MKPFWEKGCGGVFWFVVCCFLVWVCSFKKQHILDYIDYETKTLCDLSQRKRLKRRRINQNDQRSRGLPRCWHTVPDTTTSSEHPTAPRSLTCNGSSFAVITPKPFNRCQPAVLASPALSPSTAATTALLMKTQQYNTTRTYVSQLRSV